MRAAKKQQQRQKAKKMTQLVLSLTHFSFRVIRKCTNKTLLSNNAKTIWRLGHTKKVPFVTKTQKVSFSPDPSSKYTAPRMEDLPVTDALTKVYEL